MPFKKEYTSDDTAFRLATKNRSKDLSRKQTFSIKDSKNKVTFRFEYIPIIPLSKRKRILGLYDNTKIIKGVLEFMDDLHFSFYMNYMHRFWRKFGVCDNKIKFLESEIKLITKPKKGRRNVSMDYPYEPYLNEIELDVDRLEELYKIMEKQVHHQFINVNDLTNKYGTSLKKCVHVITHQRFTDYVENKLISQVKILSKRDKKKDENIPVSTSFNIKNIKHPQIKNICREVYHDLHDNRHIAFIDSRITSCTQFIEIFSNKEIKPENRVDWIHSLMTLRVFVQLLLASKVVDNVKGRWEKTVYCFTYNGNDIEPKMLSQANSKSYKTVLQNILSDLISSKSLEV